MNTKNMFILGVIAGLVDCYIEENNLNNWNVKVINDGLKLVNTKTKQHATWNIYDYDGDYKVLKSKIEKFLELQHN